ncbi:MAG: hypothetical protein IKO53_07525 [Lachnospiraceae bacterium]|nr:hypothetical protein [Lachnospiraceae bacterium]
MNRRLASYADKNYILSDSLAKAALLNFLCVLVGAGVRFIFRHAEELNPDMQDMNFALVGMVIAVVRVMLTAVIFLMANRRIKAVIANEGFADLDKLKEEMNPAGSTLLTAYSTRKMLQVWGVILVAANLLQEFCSRMYQNVMDQMQNYYIGDSMVSNEAVSLYNSTHGFKYIGMITALIIGFFVTGVFLNDRKLMVLSALMMIAFALAFGMFQMFTLKFADRSIGIVWTGVIYHLTNTVVLFIFSQYTRKKHHC